MHARSRTSRRPEGSLSAAAAPTIPGFTLIELLVVVVIISVLAAVVVPAGLSRMARRQNVEEPPEPIRQAPPSAIAAARPGGPVGRPPVFESTSVALDLHASQVLDGFRVFTRYEVDFDGTFVVRNVDPVIDTITLRFPFPPGISEVRDVSLRFRLASGELRDAPSAVYSLEGIAWTGHVRPGEEVTALVGYTAQGRDAFSYDVAGSGRSGSVLVDLRLDGARRPVVPATALQPVERDASILRWRFDHLVTTKAIVVELPAGASPLGRVILALQLAGVAVLFFGAGFWYLSEGDAPGRLDDFRWGHFLLLALNYSLFFGIFAVLGYLGSPAVALGAATVVSLPLLTVHVRRVTDLRFALTRVLPLAVLTLGTVVGGVFLDQHRLLVFLGVGVSVLAFLTLTYEPWSEGRIARARSLDRLRERSNQEAKLAASLEELRGLVDRQMQVHELAREALDEAWEGFDEERAEVGRYLDLHARSLDAARSLTEREGGPERGSTQEHADRYGERIVSAERAAKRLEGRGGSLQRSLDTLEAAMREATEALRTGRSALRDALDDASATLSEAQTMLDEGGEGQAWERAELSRALERLQALVAAAPTPTDLTAEQDMRAAAGAADRRARSVRTEVERAREALDRLRRASERATERARLERAEGESDHCVACGVWLPEESRFCAACGTPRPLDVACTGCGTVARLPRHALDASWEPVLHCSRCGRSLPVEDRMRAAAREVGGSETRSTSA